MERQRRGADILKREREGGGRKCDVTREREEKGNDG